MNTAGVDLNLLVVFEALMVERHVTRAGQRIGLSQPATSSALARLRHLFEDELFVRTPLGMQPTPMAERIAALIQPALGQIAMALADRERFEPATSDRLFRLGMSDYAEFVFLPALMRHLAAIAPKVRILVRGSDRQDALDLLDRGEIDLAVGFYPRRGALHEQQLLFEEEFVCVCRQEHPCLQASLTMEDYLASDHLLVSPKEDFSGRVDLALSRQNRQRRVALSVPHFLAALHVIANTDLIATLPKRVVQLQAQSLRLQLLPLPLAVGGFTVSFLWHSRQGSEVGHKWLRTQMAALPTTKP